MPTRLSINCCTGSRKHRLTLLFLFFPLFFFGQSLTGLWTGTLSNDSSTVRKDQLFEIVLTEYRGKVYGYSRSEFIVNDTLYYIVKRVKGTITGDVCEVTDDDIIAYNFRGKLDKGVKVTSTFRRNESDSSWYLAGTWKTNATKRYYSVSGKVGLEVEKDLTASKIFPHLEELKLADQVAFYKERKEAPPIVKIAKPEKIRTEYTAIPDPLPGTTDQIAVARPDLQRAEIKTGPAVTSPTTTDPMAETVKEEKQEPLPEIKKPDNAVAKMETKDLKVSPVSIDPGPGSKTMAVNTPPKVVTTTAPANTDEKKPAPVIVKTTVPNEEKKETRSMPLAKNTTRTENPVTPVKTAPRQEQPAKTNAVVTNANPSKNLTDTRKPVADPVTAVTPPLTKPVSPEFMKPKEDIIQKVASIAGRKSEFSQEVNYKSDSLELFLYDNGEIDGDTVSVLMNGEVIMAKQGLKAAAVRKTIYIKAGAQEDFTLVLFAENLGKYPPNTGLLVVHDGEDIYHLRFSSDFQKSTGIVFRKKN